MQISFFENIHTDLMKNRINFYSSWDIFNTFDLARDVVEEIKNYNNNYGYIIKRNKNKPKYRLYNLNLKIEDLITEIYSFAEKSYSPFTIENLTESLAFELQDKNIGQVLTSEEIIISTEDISNNPSKYFNKRGLSQLRKSEKEIQYKIADSNDIDNMISVVDKWKKHNAYKHFRLSILRDYKSIQWKNGIKFIGYRNSLPCCLHIFFKSGKEDTYIQAVEKSLNYSEIVGGKHGTADANFVFSCRLLNEMGIKYVNLGTYDGGNKGLGHHKLKLKYSSEKFFLFKSNLKKEGNDESREIRSKIFF